MARFSKCATCGSKGFPISAYGSHRCEFCDGTANGVPPSKSEITEHHVDRLIELGVKICGPNIQGFWWYVQDYKGSYNVSETTWTTHAAALHHAGLEYLPDGVDTNSTDKESAKL